jgi:hypothetical protein
MNIITLCGSTKFKQEYLDVNKWLTLQGNIVISVSLFGQADGEKITEEEKKTLDKIHFEKINLCDEIFIIDPEGYIGNSTKREIEHAESSSKGTRYLTLELENFENWKKEYYGRTNQENWNQ